MTREEAEAALMEAIHKAVHERIGRGYSGMPDIEDMPAVRAAYRQGVIAESEATLGPLTESGLSWRTDAEVRVAVRKRIAELQEAP